MLNGQDERKTEWRWGEALGSMSAVEERGVLAWLAGGSGAETDEKEAQSQGLVTDWAGVGTGGV